MPNSFFVYWKPQRNFSLKNHKIFLVHAKNIQFGIFHSRPLTMLQLTHTKIVYTTLHKKKKSRIVQEAEAKSWSHTCMKISWNNFLSSLLASSSIFPRLCSNNNPNRSNFMHNNICNIFTNTTFPLSSLLLLLIQNFIELYIWYLFH